MRTIWKSQLATDDVPVRRKNGPEDWPWEKSFPNPDHAATTSQPKSPIP
ncbi:hypothetical protein Vi05172_g6205 [Venturia inaequalis]|nr:hypothetical protein Vi05172_g6205 [Venturia inaequalis]